MTIPLSKRLQVCANMIIPGERIADIGCDHGYLSIYLLKNNIAAAVIAADINPMPLQNARDNAEKYNVTENIAFYLSDGATNIPRDFDAMVCAGMGADTIISILENALWLKTHHYRLILQCQSRTPVLRRYLSEQGWQITTETVFRDGRFLYTVMTAIWQPNACRLTPGQCYFPPVLLTEPSQELPEYYKRLIFRLKRAINGRGTDADPFMVEALAELESDKRLNFLKENINDNC